MPNRELNDPMEKSNEITHVNAELIPQDNLLKVMIRHSPRRRVLEAGAAALALLMMPKLAFEQPVRAEILRTKEVGSVQEMDLLSIMGKLYRVLHLKNLVVAGRI